MTGSSETQVGGLPTEAVLDRALSELALLRTQKEKLVEALKGLLELPEAAEELRYLDKGIGTKTYKAAWLHARSALREAGDAR